MRKGFSTLFVLLFTFLVISLGATEVKAVNNGDLKYEVIAGEAVITGYSTNLEGELVIPSNIKGNPVTSIDNYAFEMCSGLTTVIIPESVKRIGVHAFYGCSSLTSVTIPESVTSIGSDAFYGCTMLSSITFPEGLESVGRSAFDNTAWYNSQPDGLIYTGKFVYKYKGTCPTNVVVKDGTVGIVGGAFSRCTYMKTITIPEGVESIGVNAFWGCTSLSTIIIPDSVTNIGYDAFYNTAWYNAQPDGLIYAGNVAYKYKGTCPATVVIEDGTLGIAQHAFFACQGLTSIAIPNSVVIIGDEAFFACTNLVSVTIPNSLSYICDYAFSGCKGLTSIGIPESILCIGNNAFSDCTGLTSIIIPDNVTRIGDYAFANCTGISAVEIGDSVTSIGDNAFYNCISLNTVMIPDGVADLGRYVFWGCTGLTAFIIPDSVTSIGNGSFRDCSNLTSVTYCGTEQQWNLINIGEYNSILTAASIYYHSWMDPSCDAPKTCIYCQTTEGDKAHSWITATCLMPQTCDLCGITEGTTAAHSGGIWVEIVAPTCTEDGVEARICDVCNQTETSVLAAGHSYEIIITLPTCTEQGYTTKVCTRCGESGMYDYVAPNGHFWSAWLKTKEATCLTEGTELRFCNCGTRDTQVIATMPHDAQNSACDICNQLGTGYYKFSSDVQISITLTSDLYIDLNGFNLTGTIVTNSYKVYGMDSTTDEYTCNGIGYFNCVDENGNTIIPETHFKSDITGSVKRHMAIATENGYTFHRFYLGITHMSLKPGVTGLGYKAVFAGDEMVRSWLDENDAFGFSLQLDGYGTVSCYKDRESLVSGKTITMRLDNFDIENYGETQLFASVTLKLADGTVIESAQVSMTMRSMLEKINAGYSGYTDTQLAVIKAMIEKYPIIKSWNTENLYA